MPVTRVAAVKPLSPAQMTAVMILSEGWSYSEGARLMGVEYATFVTHVTDAAERLPGDLPPRLRAIAWWRGASAAVLGVRAAPATRSATLSEATTIYGGRCCPWCGKMVSIHADDATPDTGSRKPPPSGQG